MTSGKQTGQSRLRTQALLAALFLTAAACGDAGGVATTASGGTVTSATSAPTTTAAATTVPGAEADFPLDFGVTPAPCPDALNSENGCVYLGVITDLGGGDEVPFTQAQEDFWRTVNEGGGIGGFDVILSADNAFDARSDADRTVAGARALADRVLGIAQTLGTPQTDAALPVFIENEMVVVPTTRWSGWVFEEEDAGLVMESGASFCIEAMNGLSYLAQIKGTDFSWALVTFPGEHGDYGDYGAGAKLGAALLGLADPVAEISQTPIAEGGDVADAVATLDSAAPDVIVMATSPTEMSQIAAGMAAEGGEFEILGAGSTWSVALNGDPELAPLLNAVYMTTSAWGSWDFDSPGHTAMRAAAEGMGRGPHPAYIAGWIGQYPWAALLTEATASGDMTRGNLADIAADLEGIDYEGMIPEASYAGTANESAARRTIVNRADAAASDGLTAVTDSFVSEIAADYNLAAPCSVPD